MATNYLEQLIAEWYEYKGYFVRRNVLVGRRPKGGYECELDVVAFHPETKHLVHIEASMDASSWAERERRFQKKFTAGRKYIPGLFQGLELPTEIEQIAVLVFASKANHNRLGGGRLTLISELLQEIFQEFRDKHLASSAIPEHLTVLRSFQFVAEYRQVVFNALKSAG
jgi:hypothetical protein